MKIWWLYSPFVNASRSSLIIMRAYQSICLRTLQFNMDVFSYRIPTNLCKTINNHLGQGFCGDIKQKQSYIFLHFEIGLSLRLHLMKNSNSSCFKFPLIFVQSNDPNNIINLYQCSNYLYLYGLTLDFTFNYVFQSNKCVI